MANPSPRGNFLQTLLLATAIFLLLQMFFMNRPNPETRTTAEILTALRDVDEKFKGATTPQAVAKLATDAQLEIGKFNQRVSAEEQETDKAKRITADQATELRVEAQTLVALTQLRAGVKNGDGGPMTQAFHTLQDTMLRYSGKPVFESKQVVVEPIEGFSKTTYTPRELYEEIVSTLSAHNKKHLLLGFIPAYAIIDSLVQVTGAVPAFSYAFAAMLLALIVRAMIWPLAQRQYQWGRQMARMAPLVNELKEQFVDKKTKQFKDQKASMEFNQKVMALYKEYGLNPMAGCLPMFIQIPYFLLIYQCMLHYQFEFQKGTFLWINPALGAATNGWIGANLGVRDYILIVLYAASMVVTTLLTPVSDPTNAKQQKILGVVIAVFFSITMFFYPLPSAFVLYWVFTNVFATIQMLRAYRMPLPALVKVNAPGGGVYPVNPEQTNGKAPSTGVPVKHKPKKKK